MKKPMKFISESQKPYLIMSENRRVKKWWFSGDVGAVVDDS